MTGDAISEIWGTMLLFKDTVQAGGDFTVKREHQKTRWMWKIATDMLVESFKNSQHVRAKLPAMECQLQQGNITAGWAADQLLSAFLGAQGQVHLAPT